MLTYEIFLKKDGRDEFRHAGSLLAANDELALVMARESYARRAEGNRMWVVRRDHVIALGPDYLSPNAHKSHRHHDGAAVVARRRAMRESEASQ